MTVTPSQEAPAPKDSKDAKDPKAAAEAPARPAGPPLLSVLAVAAGALVGGAAIGLFAIAPRMVAARNAAPAAHAPAPEPEKPEKPEKSKPRSGKTTAYRMDNIVVNPAGSNGTRFLMASIAVEIDDPKVEAQVRERDFEMRDAVVATLERQTLEMLTHPGARDTIRNQLEAAFTPIVGSRPRVFLTQFVIQ
jgi:flagellar FliL protein